MFIRVYLSRCMHAKLLQSCPVLWDPPDCSSPGSSVHGILQARIPEWTAMPPPGNLYTQEFNPRLLFLLHWQVSSLPLKVKVKVKLLSHVQLFATSWTVAYQAPLSMRFSRQESCSGLPCPPPGDLPHPGTEPQSLTSPALAGRFFITLATWEAHPWVKWSEVAQSCPTLCHPLDCSLPGSSVHGILQARVLEWGAISFSRGSSRPSDWTQVSRIVDRRFTIWSTREVAKPIQYCKIISFQLK